jgi:hypothetical protein
MAKYENKFIVINKKRFDEVEDKYFAIELLFAISAFKEDYEQKTGKKMDQEYIVCNQDEPYVGNVLKEILEGEERKGL